MGSVNGIIGEENITISPVPQAQDDDGQLKELQAAARFAKSKQYKDLKERRENRIKFYQQYLPDGTAIGAQKATIEVAQMWVAANVIIAELRLELDYYDGAEDMLKEYTNRVVA